MRFALYNDDKKIVCFYDHDPRASFPKTALIAQVGPEAKEGDPYVIPASVTDDLAAQIDLAVAEASARPQRFTQEYLRREAQARGYLNDYHSRPAGAPPPPEPRLIAGFAKSAGLSVLAAAEVTVKQADDLYAKLDELADLRMRKYEIKRAKTEAEARAAFEAISARIKEVAATIT